MVINCKRGPKEWPSFHTLPDPGLTYDEGFIKGIQLAIDLLKANSDSYYELSANKSPLDIPARFNLAKSEVCYELAEKLKEYLK